MNQSIKYIILVILCFVGALIFNHFHKEIQFSETYTTLIATVALFRTCKEEKR